MVHLAIDGIWKVLKLHRSPRNDFYRIAAKNGIIPMLTNNLYSWNEATRLDLISGGCHGVDDSLSSGTRDSSQASVSHSSNSRSLPPGSDKPRSSTASIEGHDTRKLYDSSSFDKLTHGMMNERNDPSRIAHRISIERSQTLADGVSKGLDPLIAVFLGV
ncbi:hypothetical protein AgCh_038992 [Apium graveolens]